MSLPSVVRAFVFNPNGQILMTRHTAGVLWVLPGGHVEASESLNDAMIRELHEEFGLEARFFEIDRDEILRHKGRKLKHIPLPITTYELSYTNKE